MLRVPRTAKNIQVFSLAAKYDNTAINKGKSYLTYMQSGLFEITCIFLLICIEYLLNK